MSTPPSVTANESQNEDLGSYGMDQLQLTQELNIIETLSVQK